MGGSRLLVATGLLALSLGSVQPIAAQGDPQPAAAAPFRPAFRLGLRLGAFDMTNADRSYDAIFGGDLMMQVGLHLELQVRRKLLLGLTLDRGSVDGNRVLPADPPIPTGVAEDLTLMPLHLTVAGLWGGARRWAWYLGGGPSLVSWEDESAGRSNDGTDFGFNVVVGARRARRSWSVGGELRYSSIPDAVGDEGVSKLFGEDDIGGLAAHLVLLYRVK